jgi:hypothetical protein
MKHTIFLFAIALAVFLYSCDEEPIGQEPVDSVAPGVVSEVKVENTPGGAILTYKLPGDEDLLYVKAEYVLKEGVKSEVKASLYTDTLKIEGFGSTEARKVYLYAVDRSKNESDPVETTIQPMEPPVATIGNTLRMIKDFGGVHLYWDNPDKAEISVVVTVKDHNQEYVPIDVFYSSMINGDAASRGLDTIPYDFGFFVQDRWNNQSEVKYETITPLFEKQFDRLNFKPVELPNDEPAGYGWVLQNMWDGIIGDQGFHTVSHGVWPQSITIDLGVTGKISRIKEYQRQGDWIYRHGNLKHFEVWGAAELDPSGNWDSWTRLMDCYSVKPSGLPLGQYSAEDVTWAASGEEFLNSPENPPVRYIRIFALENWSGGDFFHMSELEVFGDFRQ